MLMDEGALEAQYIPITATLKRPPPPVMARRIDLPASDLGFATPPVAVSISFFPLPRGWSLVAMSPPAKPPAVARWLEPYGPRLITIAPGLSPKILRATFDTLPPAWQQVLDAVIVRYLEIKPDGSASLFIEDTPDKVESFVAAIHSAVPEARSRKTLSGEGPVRLTARQVEVMALAVALGYYEIPHKITLRTLAKKVALSVGAASELLRRGEALIISNYMDSLSQSVWRDEMEGPLKVEERSASPPDDRRPDLS